MQQLRIQAAHILDRLIDWLPVISYAIHNIWFALALATGTLQAGNYFYEHWRLSPLLMMLFLMVGLLWCSFLWVHWRKRVFGTVPLVMSALGTIYVYAATDLPMRMLFGIVSLYFNLILLPIVLIVVYGNREDLRKENRLLLSEIREYRQLSQQHGTSANGTGN